MDRPQIIRRVRNAAAVFFAVVAMLMSVLWVYGNLGAKGFIGLNSQATYYSLSYANNWIGVYAVSQDQHGPGENDFTHLGGDGPAAYDPDYGVKWGIFQNGWMFCCRLWMAVLACSVLSLACWRQCSARFSLRSLLIATTLVAIVLGVAVWATG
jgi:hypothetical protein